MNKNYIFKQWFSTLFISPIVSDLIIYFFTDKQSQFELTSMLHIVFIIAFIYSLPTYIIIIGTFKLLEKWNCNIIFSKILINIIAAIGIIISIIFTFGDQEREICLGYLVTSLFFGIIYKLNFKKSAESQ